MKKKKILCAVISGIFTLFIIMYLLKVLVTIAVLIIIALACFTLLFASAQSFLSLIKRENVKYNIYMIGMTLSALLFIITFLGFRGVGLKAGMIGIVSFITFLVFSYLIMKEGFNESNKK